MDWRNRVVTIRSGPVVPMASLFAVLLLLSSLAGIVAQAYHAERDRRGKRYFAEGQRLASQGKFAAAVVRYRAALSFSRENTECKLALASALVRLGRRGEAQAHLTDLLHADPVSGVANLLSARLVGDSNPQEAESYLNRAIYGYWPPDQDAERTTARFALIQLLLDSGQTKKAIGEMMQAQTELPDDPAIQKRLAFLFLNSGAPSEAADLFRRIVRNDRKDAEAYRGLGEAELRNQKYTVARAAFSYASRLDPENAQLKSRYQLADDISRLDPTLPRLRAAERYARAQTLLKTAIAQVEPCVGSTDASTAALLQMAHDTVDRHRGVRDYSDAAESDLTLLSEVVGAHDRVCGPNRKLPEPLSFVMAKLKSTENEAGAVTP